MDVNGEILVSSQSLACRTTVGIALRLVGKSLRAVAGIVLAERAVSGAHVRRDAAIQQPLQKLPVAIGRIGRNGGRLSSLPLHKAS